MSPEANTVEVTASKERTTGDAPVENALAQCALPSLFGGLIWAGFGLAKGLSVVDFLLLGCAAGVTLYLAAVAFVGWRRASHSGESMALGVTWSAVAVAALVSAALGALLHTSTNHRPLGAVTWVCLTAAVTIGAVMVTVRLRPSARVGLVVLAVALTALAALGASAVPGRVWLEAAGGVVLLAGVLFARRAIQPALEQIWWGPVGVLAAGSVVGVAVGATPRLHEVAPLVAGVVGLLH